MSAALATWKDLCIDALDRRVLGEFWAAALGLDLVVGERNVSLDGPTDKHRIWVNEVDRPHVVKNRLHLDIDVASVDDLVALGAQVVLPAAESGWSWTTMLDPEGNEFCAFERAPDAVSAYRLHGVVIDSRDPFSLAAWWGGVLGVEPIVHAEHGYATLEGAAVDERMTLDFVPVPEPRTAPNRVHWDLWGEVAPLLERGATHLWDTERWTVLADPEGNEFCVFTPAG